MPSEYGGVACPKPAKREKKAPPRMRRQSKPKAERDHTAEIRAYVFARERGRCRCCRFRAADSMHEIIPRSRGGKVSKRNSIAVCGQLGNGPECHGRLQRYEIMVVGVIVAHPNAEEYLWFAPKTTAAREWMKLAGDRVSLESAPIRHYEED